MDGQNRDHSKTKSGKKLPKDSAYRRLRQKNHDNTQKRGSEVKESKCIVKWFSLRGKGFPPSLITVTAGIFIFEGFFMTRSAIDPVLKEALQRRKGTRLMVVQALYQRAQTGVSPEELIQDFFEGPLKEYFADKGILGDPVYFAEIVKGAILKQEEIDGWISQFLVEGWRIQRLEAIVLAILRAASYELWGMRDVPKTLIVNEYVSMTHGFFTGREPQFVNALLEKIANLTRPSHEN
jgi:N utilization substance protein B